MKTPGKWINQTMGGSEDGRQILCGKLHIATCHYGSGIDVNEAEANARLIAASPMLLEALKTALQIIEAEPEACGIYKAHTEKIRAAITAAEGTN
jgi:hypothetical protein